MTTRPCAACRHAIGFIRTPAGRATPVNPERVTCWVRDVPPADGPPFQIILVLADGRLVRGYRALDAAPDAREVTGYVSHFATCTDVARFRRPSALDA